LPFAVLCLFLYLVGREKMLSGPVVGSPHGGLEAGKDD
jgi:hypothetical protein